MMLKTFGGIVENTATTNNGARKLTASSNTIGKDVSMPSLLSKRSIPNRQVLNVYSFTSGSSKVLTSIFSIFKLFITSFIISISEPGDAVNASIRSYLAVFLYLEAINT